MKSVTGLLKKKIDNKDERSQRKRKKSGGARTVDEDPAEGKSARKKKDKKSKGKGKQEQSKTKKDKEKEGKDNKDNVKTTEETVRPKATAEDEGGQTQTTIAAPKNVDKKAVVKVWLDATLGAGVAELRAQFKALATYVAPDMTVKAFQANMTPLMRNRYQDVPCQDYNRVELKWPGGCDYIHANYVATPRSPKRFICTQGPLDATINEFWQMVIQEESETIIMLCNCIETGKYKCAQYWPTEKGETKTLEGTAIAITNNGTGPMCDAEPSVLLTTFLIKYKKGEDAEKEREIRHFQWTDWPDRGVPPCRLTAMELLSRVRGNKQPVVVHCSAGIGRTGTIVSIEYLMETITHGNEMKPMNVLLKELRNQRAWTIQNDLQYLYVHRIIMCYFLEKHRALYEDFLGSNDNDAKYKKFIEDYSAATGTN